MLIVLPFHLQEINIVALDRGEWIPEMSDAAFKRYKSKGRPRLPSFFESESRLQERLKAQMETQGKDEES